MIHGCQQQGRTDGAGLGKAAGVQLAAPELDVLQQAVAVEHKGDVPAPGARIGRSSLGFRV